MKRIDIFCHINPIEYREFLYKHLPASYIQTNRNLQGNERLRPLWDMEYRLETLADIDDYVQVLSINMPSPDIIADPKYAAEAAKVVNDAMAKIVNKYPERFIAGVACVAMTNMKEAVKEAERAVKELGLKGVRLDTSVRGKPLDAPEFWPLYEKMTELDLPIWIHPIREPSTPDYPTEEISKYGICSLFGWPYETSATMIRLVCSGVLEKYPNLKIITHHCGGFVPFFPNRIEHMWDLAAKRGLPEAEFMKGLSKRPIEYFRMFYNDTVVSGGSQSMMCGYNFFGADHLLFATDAPFDIESGRLMIREITETINTSDIPDSDKKKIYQDNAIKLLRLEI